MASRAKKNRYQIGIDVGGTFTDLVLLDTEQQTLRTHKVISTPDNPARAILHGLDELLGPGWQSKELVKSITHGSTVATNALLERKGARTALITTKGFRDIYKIGRQNRSELYNFFINPTPPLILNEHAIEVEERVNAKGEIKIPLRYDSKTLANFLIEEQVESIAVSLIFSFANPEHELEIGRYLTDLGFFVSLSSDILPEFREYERTSTTLVNAYVSPILKSYLESLEQEAGSVSVRIMQSNGGSISVKEASRYGARCILSGPAGGIAAALAIRGQGALPEFGSGLITFDMGGTSTDVSLLKQLPTVIKDAVIGGFPIAIPVLDIHTIGAGGGSIAYLDSGNALRVGPQSAGADPGPACYGTGDLPTVTDANLVLGRILPEHFLGGEMRLYKERAVSAIQSLAAKAKLTTIQCAQGILDIANIYMAKALRVISVERGEDPADYLLVSFGGAGSLHAVDLAKLVGITKVYIPNIASVFSAFGMLAADAVRDYSLTVMRADLVDLMDLEVNFSTLEKKALAELTEDGFLRTSIELQRQVDARYKGQSYEITIPFTHDYQSAFHAAHLALFGYDRKDGMIDIVTIRVRAVGKSETVPTLINNFPGTHLEEAILGETPVCISGAENQLHSEPKLLKTPVYSGEKLPVGTILKGPLLIVRKDTTILAGSNDLVNVLENGSLVIEIGNAP